MKKYIILFLFSLVTTVSLSNMLHSDYLVNNNKVYLVNPNFYENIKVKNSENGRYEVTDTGDFNFISDSGRNIVFTLKNGLLTGDFIEYYENGEKLLEGKYSNNQKNGKWYMFNDKGAKWKQETYKDGVLEGEYVEWYANTGRTKEKGNFRKNKKTGKWSTYYTNGQKESEGDYKDNQKTGKWTVWYSSGRKKLETEYVNGEIAGSDTAYYENGNIFYEGKYNNGQGTVTSYFSTGELKFQGSYKLRKKEGLWKYYDRSGNLLATETYDNGMIKY